MIGIREVSKGDKPQLFHTKFSTSVIELVKVYCVKMISITILHSFNRRVVSIVGLPLLVYVTMVVPVVYLSDFGLAF